MHRTFLSTRLGCGADTVNHRDIEIPIERLTGSILSQYPNGSDSRKNRESACEQFRIRY